MMPYQPYQPTWNNPYLAQLQGYQNQQAMQQYPQQYQQQEQPWNSVKVDGAAEAMNRFLMHYPASMLLPGFISEPLFDVDKKHFHTLSIEVDGRRNLETFRYEPEDSGGFTADKTQFVSRSEFDEFTAKVNAALGALNGVHEPVSATTAAVPAAGTAGRAEVQDGAASLNAAR